MACIRLRFPLLVLAIILIATSHTVLGKNEEAKGAGLKEDGIVMTSVSSTSGRKMVSAQHLEKDETGLRELYSEKIMDSTTTKATRKIGVFKSDDTVVVPNDAAAEMFNMLNKDYRTTARRRPPINNSSPLKDDDDDGDKH